MTKAFLRVFSGAMFAVTAFASQAGAAAIEEYLTGEIRHLQLVRGAASFYDALVVTGTDNNDKRIEKLDGKKGKVLLVTFWSVDCLRCRPHLRQLQELQEMLGREKVEIVALNIDGIDKRPFSYVRNFLDRRSLPNLTAYMDHGNMFYQEVLNDPAYALIGGQPKTLIVDTSGTVRALANARKDWTKPEVVAFLEALHKKQI